MDKNKTYTVKLFKQSPFYVSIPDKSVYVLCDEHGDPYAQIYSSPWFLKEGMQFKGEDFEVEVTNVRSKHLEPGDIVTFSPFSEGKIEKIIPAIEGSWDWNDKFVLINCKSTSPKFTTDKNRTLLRSECEHVHYRICTIKLSEIDLWEKFGKAWTEFAVNNTTPSTVEVIEFLKDKVKIKQ